MPQLMPASGHAAFLALLPRLQAHARVRFHFLNHTDLEEVIADVVAYAFASFLRLQQRGKDPTAYPAMFAQFIVRAVANGRGVVRRLSVRDVMAFRSRGERLRIHRLDDPMPEGGWWRDAVLDRRTPVDEQVAFLVDFPAWLATLPAMKRHTAELLAWGHRTDEVASRAGLTASRISQLRKELADSWTAFHADS